MGTDVMALTCEEVNAKIAELRQEQDPCGYRPLEMTPIPGVWEGGELPAWGPGPPDYCHEWKWGMRLWNDLLAVAHKVFVVSPVAGGPIFSGTAMTPGHTQELWHIPMTEMPEAVARAWLQLYGDEHTTRMIGKYVSIPKGPIY